VLTEPGANGLYAWQALINSLIVAGGTALVAAALSLTAAYAFSRFRFPGRQAGMLTFIVVQMMPPGALLVALFVLLNGIRVESFDFLFIHLENVSLRQTLLGLSIAYAATTLPFLIWNLKGYFDTIPKELEEAAVIDGAAPLQAFRLVILPLSLPALVVNTLFAFMAGWSEYVTAVTFLTDGKKYTLAIVLAGMVGQYGGNTRWSDWAALSLLMSVPIILLFFFMQRWLVSGLTVGGVKG
jgi:arabinogalactan oligomer/maltooligosaccharide transport system permease protein